MDGAGEDVTDEREPGAATDRETVERALDVLEDVFFVVDPETESLLRWNDRLGAVTGYNDGDLATTRVGELIDDDHVDDVRAAMATAVSEGAASVEADLVTNEGERIPHEFRGTPLYDNDDLVGIAGVGRDIRDRLDRQRELERYETVVQAVGDPVYALDDDGVVTFANDAMAGMTGYAVDDLVGSHIGTVLSEADLQRGRERIREMLSDPTERARKFEVTVRTADGETVPSELHIALLPMADGEFRGTAGIVRDITERKRREKRLEEFAGVVSHDLRNPLNVIQGNATVLHQDYEDDERVDAIVTAADRMEGLIDDLLTLARQGDSVGATETVALEAIAEDAWASVDAPEATLDQWTTVTVEADPDRLRELLENLFRNAVEHGHDGVEITVDCLDEGTGFFVEDDGPGIPPERRDEVFDHGYTTNEQGTGFGLSIVKRIANAHGWTVEVTESETGGARFEFRTG